MASVSDPRDSPAQVQPPALGSGDLSHRPDQLLPELQEGGQYLTACFSSSLSLSCMNVMLHANS